MPTGEMTDETSVKKRLAEGRELTKPLAAPPPPRTPRPKESGTQEGPDKRRMRYLLRRALFAFEEALGLIAVLGTYFPELQRLFKVANLPQVMTNIIVALREKLFELHDEGAPMADVPEDDTEQIAMQYLGEITPASALSKDPLSGKDMQELSRRLGAVPESERIQQIKDVLGPDLNIPGPLPLPEAPKSPSRGKLAEIFRWIFSRGKFWFRKGQST